MRNLNKLMLMSLALLALLVGGCGDNASGKVSYPDGKISWAAHSALSGVPKELHDGIQARAAADGIQFDAQNAGDNANLQLDQVNQMVDEKPSVIVLLAMSGDSIIPAVEKANKAGVPVIATNRDVNGGIFTNVINDEKQAGQLQGAYMAAHLPQNAKVVYLSGEMSISAGRLRWEGFKEALLDKRPDVQLLAKSSTGDWTYANGVKNMTLWMQMFPQIDGVASGNDNMALGALQAMKAAGRYQPGMIFCGVDAGEDALASIEAGEMTLTVKQDAKGIADTIYELIKEIRKGNAPEPGEKLVPMIEVTKANVAKYK
ncbi:sugar ABC transporter substrate-binding protein [Anaerovibrio sp.]|uniref:sugar ABC transporter substrate-binding protein n=1 Tax=Anaerovibrio sp. TaxID=1872532 RepID=UPI003F1840A3